LKHPIYADICQKVKLQSFVKMQMIRNQPHLSQTEGPFEN